MADSTSEGGAFFEKYGTAIALLLGLIIIAGAIMYGRPNTAGTTGTPGEKVAVDIKDVKTEGSPFVGAANAPVTMAVWFDYQCGYCKRFETTTLAELKQEYIDNGQVKVVYKDYQFLGQASIDTAVYSRAVWEAYPGEWAEWFNKVAASAAGEVTLDRAGLDAVSVGFGMDTARIATLVTQNQSKYLAAIEADRAEGVAFGVSGTPGSIVGTSLIEGAQPYTAVKPLIEAELAN